MVVRADGMLAFGRRLSESIDLATRRPSSRGRTRRRIRQIDALVYELYGLLEEEVAIVEVAAR
jgi:hypothetical protein